MGKGSGCCCGKCDTRLNCSQGQFTGGANTVAGGAQCCKCVPTRLCFALEFADYTTVRQTVKISCEEGFWFATFSINGSVLSLRLEIVQDVDGDCWMALSSTQLRLVLHPAGYDDRLFQPLIGSFDNQYDATIRRSTCLNPEYEFDIDLSGYGKGMSRLTVNRARYVSSKNGSRNWQVDPYACMCQCVCISIEHIDGSKYRQIVCLEGDRWVAGFDILDNQYVIVTRESAVGEPTVLSMESSVGLGERVGAECGCLTNMYAEWQTAYGLVKITCAGKGCIDCNCWCEDLCFEYQDDVQRVSVIATWDPESEGWAADLLLEGNQYPTRVIVIKVCNAEIEQTQLVLDSPFGESTPQNIECPEIFATWNFVKPGTDQPIRLTVNCATCGTCQGPVAQEPCGCYEFIPETLYATFSPSADVPPDPPETPGQNAACAGASGVIVMRALVAAGAVAGWTGCGYPFAGCPTLRVCLEMQCITESVDASGLRLRITYSDAGTDVVKFPDEHACEPYYGLWKLINKDPLCCQSTGTVENLYDITITE